MKILSKSMQGAFFYAQKALKTKAFLLVSKVFGSYFYTL